MFTTSVDVLDSSFIDVIGLRPFIFSEQIRKDTTSQPYFLSLD
jgi:hypothetical protein